MNKFKELFEKDTSVKKNRIIVVDTIGNKITIVKPEEIEDDGDFGLDGYDIAKVHDLKVGEVHSLKSNQKHFIRT